MSFNKIPEDLNINYTPRRLTRTCDVKRGDTISFKYMNGENPGKRRTVLVTEVDNNHVKGFCLERDCEYRNFLWDYTDNPVIVPPFVRKRVSYEQVSLSEYMQSLMTG